MENWQVFPLFSTFVITVGALTQAKKLRKELDELRRNIDRFGEPTAGGDE